MRGEVKEAHRIYGLLFICERGNKNPTVGKGDRGAPSYLKVGSTGCEEFGSGDGPLPQSQGFFLFPLLFVFQSATVHNHNTEMCKRLKAIPQIMARALTPQLLHTRSLMAL